MIDIDPRHLHTPVIDEAPRHVRIAGMAISAAAVALLIACSPAGREEASNTASQAASTIRTETANAATDIKNATSDAALTAKVKSVLLADAQVKGTSINVDAEGGTVILSGNVATPSEKMRAEQLAQGVEGVQSVRNNLSAPGG